MVNTISNVCKAGLMTLILPGVYSGVKESARQKYVDDNKRKYERPASIAKIASVKPTGPSEWDAVYDRFETEAKTPEEKKGIEAARKQHLAAQTEIRQALAQVMGRVSQQMKQKVHRRADIQGRVEATVATVFVGYALHKLVDVGTRALTRG